MAIRRANVAEHLLSNATSEHSESFYRASISRSYYAVFNRALGKLRDKGEMLQWEDRIHSAVISRLQSSNDGGVKKIGFRLNTLRTQRVKADYTGDKSVDEREAKIALSNAKTLIEKIERMVGNY